MIFKASSGFWLIFVFFLSSVSLDAQISVDFSSDVTTGCSSVQSNFKDKSVSSVGEIVKWSWKLGGGKSILQHPGKIFTEVGSYDICLTVTDDKGNTGNLCKENFITVYDLPKANFEIDLSSGCAPLNVSYTDLSSSANGMITNWSWGLNGSNGIIITSDPNREISSNYITPDIYTISLTISDEKGCTNSVTKPNLIEVIARPEIKVTTLGTIGCSFPMTVDFVNQGEDENIEYSWDFGNGESYVGYDPEAIVYSKGGNYNVEIIALNLVTLCADTLILKDYINSGGTILFDFYPKEICRNGLVQFEDLSPVEADKWEWDFGDGTKSTKRDPSHTYVNPGKYFVSLSRTTSECEGIQVSEYQVEVQENPTFDYEIDKSNACLLPAEVKFKTNYDDGSLYHWYIGKPGAYTKVLVGQESNYAFEEYGSYEVRLLVDNKIGCRTIELIDTVELEPFKIDIIGQSEGCVPFIADLEVVSNSKVPLSNISWNINGSDSITSSNEHITMVIGEVGSYELELAVENEAGCKDTIRGNDIIKGGSKPTVNFGISDDEICPNELISFEDLSSSNVDTWNWFFNDSTVSDVQNPEMTFNTPGKYKVQLDVGHNGCYNTLIKDDLFVVNFPKVSFNLDYNCDDPYRIKAISNSSNYDSLVWSYKIGSETIAIPHKDSIEINFPDKEIYILSLQAFNYENGCDNIVSDTVWISDLESKFSISSLQGCTPLIMDLEDESVDALSWKYVTSEGAFMNDTLSNTNLRINRPGEYDDVGLIVTGRHGCQDTSFSSPIKVNKVYASFPAPDPVCINDTLSIENNSTSLFSNISEVKWVMGDGIETSYLENGDFALGKIGKHDLKLVVEDEWGCKDSTVTGLAAFFRAPNFELIADSISCTTHELEFRNLVHASNYRYNWNFGDGTSSKVPNPVHLYETEGNYDLSVIVEDDGECVNELIFEKHIKVANPLASFAVDSTFSACPPLATTFTNESEHSLSQVWNFGDETGLSGELDPLHLYVEVGVYDVELIAVRTEYCQDTILLSDLIQLEGPKGEFKFEIDSSCVPLNVSFEAELEDDYLLIWDFGDGNLQEIDEKSDFSVIDYTYENTGDFIPKIILEDGSNCKITKAGDEIQTHALEAKFGSLDTVFCNEFPNSVLLENHSYTTSPISSFQWNIGPHEFNVENPAYSLSDTGRYDVNLIVGNGFCEDTLTKLNYISVGAFPELYLTQDTFNCLNSDITLNVSSKDQNDQLTWYNLQGGFIKNGTSNAIKAQDNSQSFIVEAINDYQCLVVDTVFVEVIDDKTKFAGPDKTICFGSALELTVDYGTNILWTNVTECQDCSTVSLTPDALSTYYLEITNEYGCLVKDTLNVDVLYQDDIEAGEDQNVCITERPVLLAFVEGDIQWSPSNLLDSPNDYLTAANISESTMFFLESTKDECTLKDSVYVNILKKANLEAVGDTVCYGEMSQLRAGGSIDDVRWEVDADMISNMEILNPTSNTIVSTRFMAIGNLGGCIPDTAYADVMVYPEIVAQLPEVRQYFRGTEEIEVNLKVFSSGDYEFSWSPADMVNCSNCPSIMIQSADTSQMVSVEILERESGCVDTLSVMVREFYGCQSAASGIGIPNIFSPNDDGINDVLNIESPAFDDVESVAIFDRWGQQVFYTNSVTESWDGKLKGVPVHLGVYTYLVQAVCTDTGEVVQISGDVTVIR